MFLIGFFTNEQIKQLIKEKDLKTAADVQNVLKEMFGETLIKEWQNRPLQQIYAMVFLDAIHFKVKQDGQIVNKAAYMTIGIDLDRQKDVLGIWIGENESAPHIFIDFVYFLLYICLRLNLPGTDLLFNLPQEGEEFFVCCYIHLVTTACLIYFPVHFLPD